MGACICITQIRKKLNTFEVILYPDGFGALLTTFCNWLIKKINNIYIYINALLNMSDLDHLTKNL